MSDDTTSRPDIFPALRYRDARAAMNWMTEVLGFRSGFEVPEPDGSIAHAELHFGTGVVMLGSARSQSNPAKPWESTKNGIYISVDDIDAHYARAKAAGAEIVLELHTTDYGSRDYVVCDPEGNYWFFGTYRPNP